jgi:hypothetical protein
VFHANAPKNREILYIECRYKGKENNESNQTEAVQKKKAETAKTEINWRLGDPSGRQG